jgi:hypothetical protein
VGLRAETSASSRATRPSCASVDSAFFFAPCANSVTSLNALRRFSTSLRTSATCFSTSFTRPLADSASVRIVCSNDPCNCVSTAKVACCAISSEVILFISDRSFVSSELTRFPLAEHVAPPARKRLEAPPQSTCSRRRRRRRPRSRSSSKRTSGPCSSSARGAIAPFDAMVHDLVEDKVRVHRDTVLVELRFLMILR